MINWLKTIIDLILPPRCLICGKVLHTDNSLCPECFENIHFITKPYCTHCGKQLYINNSYNEVFCADCLQQKDSQLYLSRSAIQYDEFSKKLILDFKFADHIENKKLLSNWLYIAGKDIFATNPDIILPVPLHFSRLLKRKYNQSAILAAELSKLTHIPVNYNILKKHKYTKPQATCSGKQRRNNIKNAFIVKNIPEIYNKHIILIDDVYTTGSTLNECAKILKKSGAKLVSALTIAKVDK